MAYNNDLVSPKLARTLWRANGFLWLQENRQFSDFDLDTCLCHIEADPAKREPALAAFWGTYFARDIPPTLNDQQVERISNLLEPGLPRGATAKEKDLKNLAFVRLHLAGLLAVCLIRPDWPVDEYPSVTLLLEKMLEAYLLAERPEIDVIFLRARGQELLEKDLFGFSTGLLGGICRLELSLRRAEEGKYEEAFELFTQGCWDICATTVEAGPTWGIEGTPGLPLYLPHSGAGFNIQEAVNIFEGLKEHSNDVQDWKEASLGCEVLWYLGTEGLYDLEDAVKDRQGEIHSANDYWMLAKGFCESQMRMLRTDSYILTRDAIERAETQQRLKRDFLPGNLWDAMRPEAQKALVGAELHWMHDRLDAMVKDIRHLLELVLPSVLPFLQPLAELKSDSRLILTRMRDALRENRRVRASIDGLRIDQDEKDWIKNELHIFLHKVIDTRNYFEKEQYLSGRDRDRQKYRNNAVDIHNQLLGVGCIGVLPRLLRIKQTPD